MERKSLQNSGLFYLPALAREGRLNEAIIYYTRFLDKNPNSPDAHRELATSYALQGKYDDAVKHYKKALQLIPDWPGTLNNLSVLLTNKPNATALERVQAVRYAERCCQLTGYLWAESLVTLTDAYAAAGRVPFAIRTAEKAIKLAEAADEKDLAQEIQERLGLYKSDQPYRKK